MADILKFPKRMAEVEMIESEDMPDHHSLCLKNGRPVSADEEFDTIIVSPANFKRMEELLKRGEP